jgi:NTE family protein
VRVAVVLTAVGSAGAVQAGLLVALTERGVRPAAFVGSSAGAVNAAVMAAGGGGHAAAVELAGLWSSAPADLLAVSPAGALAGLLGDRGHVLPPGLLRARLARHVRLDRLEEAPVAVHLIAADASSGEPLVLSRGPALDAVMASAALPGLLPAVRWNGSSLVDGSLAAAGALDHALGLRADRVLVLGRPGSDRAADGGVAAVAVRTLSMLARRQLALDVARHPPAPRVTTVCPPPVDPADFSALPRLVEHGIAEGRRLLSSQPGWPPTAAAGSPACPRGARRGATAHR